jgi:hypothetical protein
MSIGTCSLQTIFFLIKAICITSMLRPGFPISKMSIGTSLNYNSHGCVQVVGDVVVLGRDFFQEYPLAYMCINHIEESTSKTDKSLPTRGGSSPSSTRTTLHLSMTKAPQSQKSHYETI